MSGSMKRDDFLSFKFNFGSFFFFFLSNNPCLNCGIGGNTLTGGGFLGENGNGLIGILIFGEGLGETLGIIPGEGLGETEGLTLGVTLGLGEMLGLNLNVGLGETEGLTLGLMLGEGLTYGEM